ERNAHREYRAHQRDGEGLPGAGERVAERSRRQIGREQLPHVRRDLAHGLTTGQRGEVDAGALIRPCHQGHESGGGEPRRPLPCTRRPAGGGARHHPTIQARMRPLMRSTAPTSTSKILKSVMTSSNWNIRMESSICWPSPPAPTKPMIAEARMA